ncbi:MAG: hypothetical protein ACO1OF_13970 [Adhaeribacter sp.]
MRGIQTLHTNLLPSAVIIGSNRKGQRNVHQKRRDDALAYRYYYHAQLLRKRYDDCLVSLEVEFHLTPAVIIQRLNTREPMLKELVSQKVTKEALKRKLPHYTW